MAVLGRDERFGVPDADLYLCGYGLCVPDDITLATVDVMRRVKTVYCLPVPDWPADLPAPPCIRDLGIYYSAAGERAASYAQMADELLDAAQRDGPVALLTYGHPFVGMDVTQLVLSGAPSTLRVECVNAPSSIESVCSSLGYDPFHGLSVIEASHLLERQLADVLPLSWPLFVMQVPYVGATMATHLSSRTHRYDPRSLEHLRDKLVRAYGAEHQATFVRARVLSHPEAVRSFPLSELVTCTPSNAATLVVPPLGARQRAYA